MQTLEPEVEQAIAVRPSMAVGNALRVDEILAQVKLVQDVMKKVMVEGEHYGKVPGCGDKKVLLQPGAQKLTMTFRLAPEYDIQEVNLDRGHKEYRVICTLKAMGSGSFVGQGVGCCSSMESKYRWRGGARKCPECGKETIIKGKEQFGGGWLCWTKKGGCGAKWEDGEEAIESQSIEKVENENPADTFNTVLKMSKKRAFVDATITATAASDIFTQDLIEDGDLPQDESPAAISRPTVKTPPRGKSAPQAPASSDSDEVPMNFEDLPKTKPGTPAELPHPMATPDQRTKMVAELKAGPGMDNEKLVSQYFAAIGAILSTEAVVDVPLPFVPALAKEMRELGVKLAEFERGDGAERCSWMPKEGSVAPPEAKQEAKKANPVSAPANGETGEWWRGIIVPIPRKGMKKEVYLRSPDTIGSLFDARHGKTADDQDARQRLWGFCNSWEPKGWNGKPPTDADLKFKVAIDAFKSWYSATHPNEKL